MIQAVLNGPSGRTILGPTGVTIGSASDNQLVMNNYAVSAHHAEIRPEERSYSITDLGSAYGTFVNDQRLDWDVPYPLNSGDTLLIGDTRYTFEMREAHQLEEAAALSQFSSTTDVFPEQPGVTNLPPLPPKKSSRRKLWIPIAIVVVLALLGTALAYFLVIRSTPEKTLDAFCNSIQRGDYKGAYGDFSSALQKTESEPQFESENKGTSCTHSSATQSGGGAKASLTTTSSSGTKSSGQVTLVQDSNNNWKIDALPSTPYTTLDAFCSGIQNKDYQKVYNQLSSRVQGQDSEPAFANSLAQSGIAYCTYGTLRVSSTTATGTIIFFSATGQTASYVVTLVKEGSGWRIDDIASG